MTNKKSYKIISHLFVISALSAVLFFSAHAIFADNVFLDNGAVASEPSAALVAQEASVSFAEIDPSINIISPDIKTQIAGDVDLVVNLADYKPDNGDPIQVARRVGDPKDPKNQKNIANGKCEIFSEECFVGTWTSYPTADEIKKDPSLLKEPNTFLKDGSYNIWVTVNKRNSSVPFPIIVNNANTPLPTVVPFAKVDKSIMILAPQIKSQIGSETKLVVNLAEYKIDTKEPLHVSRRVGDLKDPKNQKDIADGTCELFSKECFL